MSRQRRVYELRPEKKIEHKHDKDKSRETHDTAADTSQHRIGDYQGWHIFLDKGENTEDKAEPCRKYQSKADEDGNKQVKRQYRLPSAPRLNC